MLDGPKADLLFAVTRAVRAFLETMWMDWRQDRGSDFSGILSPSTYGRSSTFLQRVMRAEASIRSAVVAGDYDHAGARTPHAWVVAGDWIVDVTSDQFEASPTSVTAANDPPDRAGIDRALPEFIADRAATVDRASPYWLASDARRELVLVLGH